MTQVLGKDGFISKIKSSSETSRSKAQGQLGDIFQTELIRIEEKSGSLWLTFKSKEIEQSINIPIPSSDEKGLCFIEEGHVKRAVGTWFVDGKEIDFWNLIYGMFTDNPQKFAKTSSKRTQLDRLVRSFIYGSAPIVFKGFQKVIDSYVNALPIVGTDMQNWAMCHRMQIVDSTFKDLPPNKALEYQKTANEILFPCTSLGLSDSGMCNNNILTVDVRKTIPFGIGYHNPRRNLYQTLGMRGDEPPKIMSRTEKTLSDVGINRTGWNLMTLFVDMPLNFEDQIIVSNRLEHLFTMETKSYTTFGTTLVREGDSLNFLYPLAIEPDGSFIRFNLRAESAIVSSVIESVINFNNAPTKIRRITIIYKRTFKEGVKITNRHGNKGVITLQDTGVIHDPVRGDVPIDVIVSASSVQKRKNFGQLLEALSSLIHGSDKETIVEDEFVTSMESIKDKLSNIGYSEDGTVTAATQWGDFRGVAGWIFWGYTKTPEDQLWTKYDTDVVDGRGVRQAGNKLSHIEFRALLTTFGKKNPIIKEILKHSQGEDQVFEYIRVLESINREEKDIPTIEWDKINPVNQTGGFFHHLIDFSGTVSDETLCPNGFYLKLPDDYKYILKKAMFSEFSEEFTNKHMDNENDTYILDKILIPSSKFRKPWKHQSGQFGLSDISALANAIVSAIHKYKNEEVSVSQVGRAVFLYFHTIAGTLSSKNGKISNYCLSIRYPYTIKATAGVSDILEPNQIELHREMANDLRILEGDIVLVERFPCLGFMSVRAQKVKITDEPLAKYVVKVSGSSLSSLTLDFDGDVIYIMSFHSKESRVALETEFNNPHPARLAAYEKARLKKIPGFRELVLDEYNIQRFGLLNAKENAEIVEGLTGIKRGTGTIIALCYNIMRILEGELDYNDPDTTIAMEILLDKVANSVFSRKHAGRSLEKECKEAICTARVDKMVELGFDKSTSIKLTDIIRKKAALCGFRPESLEEYYKKAELEGRSSIVNIIVRKFHKFWFTTRSNLHPIVMIKNINTEPKDLTGWMFKHAKEKMRS